MMKSNVVFNELIHLKKEYKKMKENYHGLLADKKETTIKAEEERNRLIEKI